MSKGAVMSRSSEQHSDTPGEKLSDDEVDVSGGFWAMGTIKSVAHMMNGAGAAPGTEGAGEVPPVTSGAIEAAEEEDED